MRYRRALLAALVVMALSSVSYGRVFERWAGWAAWKRALVSLGGHSAYEAQVRVNNQPGELRVFRFDATIEALLGELRDLFPSASIAWAGGGMARFSLRHPKLNLALIILEVRGGNTVAFAMAEDPDTSAMPQAASYPPLYPGSETGFSFSDDNRLVKLTVSVGNALPSEVLRHYDALLGREGWQRPFSSLEPASTEEVSGLYFKGNSICVVSASLEESGHSRITLLHKKAQIK